MDLEKKKRQEDFMEKKCERKDKKNRLAEEDASDRSRLWNRVTC